MLVWVLGLSLRLLFWGFGVGRGVGGERKGRGLRGWGERRDGREGRRWEVGVESWEGKKVC